MKKPHEKEKMVHDKLLQLLKEHFSEDEQEMMEDDESEMAPDMFSPISEMEEGDYDSEGADDEEYEGMEDDDEEEEPEGLDKDKRKRLAVMVITKKAGIGKKK